MLLEEWKKMGEPDADGHRTKPETPKPTPPPEAPPAVEPAKIVEAVGWGLLIWRTYELVKWGIAAAAAAPTGGASLGVAAALP
jgi:hypothetical protein